jgi:hypothetical protein
MTSTHCRRRTTWQFLKVASLAALLLEMTQSTGPSQRPCLEICCVMLTSTDGMMADRHRGVNPYGTEGTRYLNI